MKVEIEVNPEIISITGNPTNWTNENVTLEVIAKDELYGLAELSNGGNTFEGKTIKLSKDIYLN
mgnify:CR=1 FL=1